MECGKSLSERARARTGFLDEVTARFVRFDTQTPPSDTTDIVKFCSTLLSPVEGVEIRCVSDKDPVRNLLARVRGRGPGKRLLLNGHLDTFLLADRGAWSVDPFGARVRDGRMYGLGVADMKAGSASLLTAFMQMAAVRDTWDGELVLSLVGDEEAGGTHGTRFLLETQEWMRADACIVADIGGSRVLRFGEKGRVRLELTARGTPGHGAHLHKTINAVDILIRGIISLEEQLQNIPISAPPAVLKAVLDAAGVSESFAGQGETQTIRSITCNVGVIKGGTVANLVPGEASALIDIRLPIGVEPETVIALLDGLCRPDSRLSWKLLARVDPMYSDPGHEIFSIVARNSEAVWGAPCVNTIRVGGTDAKHLRVFGIPTVNCGVEGANMGAPDEYVELEELHRLLEIHVLSAFDYLISES